MKNNGWILAKDRLPKQNEIVLAFLESTAREGYTYAIASYSNEFWFVQLGDLGHATMNYGQWEVKAWREIPKMRF